MERQRPSEPPKNKQELKEMLQRTWTNMDPAICEKLVLSMPKRLEAVIAARGGPTKY
ncbi:MAG: hypothetical protein MJA29_12090 [Candidatus Omnitrophica bacterium]|nr:hypothetical protein [Candidatus Omnitrophota bacterium]